MIYRTEQKIKQINKQKQKKKKKKQTRLGILRSPQRTTKKSKYYHITDTSDFKQDL